MAQRARDRGIGVCQALGEQLPFRTGQFDVVLLVTVICFVEDVGRLLREVHRVLRIGGHLVLGFIDRQSALGREYEARRGDSLFYRHARFYSAPDVIELARRVGFGNLTCRQTVFGLSAQAETEREVRDGYGEGAFVVLSGEKAHARGRP